MTMCYMQDMVIRNPRRKKVFQFVQSYGLMKGLKKFGEKGRKAAYKEMKQLHDRVVFKPIHIEELTELERKRAMESLIFLVEKRDGTFKGRTCANGSTQREYTDRDEAASPTAMTESIIITGVIDAKQRRDIMTADIPNAFVQTRIDEKEVGERIIMKIRGPLVDMLLELSPETYQGYVVYEGKSKVLYVMMVMALYGMLQSSLLYYKKFRKDIESIGFKVNPYDPCVANRMINGKQHTITWHVDDLKSSHVDPKVNDDFFEWLKMKYASDEIGEVKAVRGHRHDYLACTDAGHRSGRADGVATRRPVREAGSGVRLRADHRKCCLSDRGIPHWPARRAGGHAFHDDGRGRGLDRRLVRAGPGKGPGTVLHGGRHHRAHRHRLRLDISRLPAVGP